MSSVLCVHIYIYVRVYMCQCVCLCVRVCRSVSHQYSQSHKELCGMCCMCVACVWAPFDCPVPLCELRCLCPYKLYSLTVQTDTLTSFLKKITLNIVHITRLFGCLDQDIFRKHPPFTTGCWYLTNHNTALCVCKKPTFTFSTSSSVFLDTSKVCIKHTKKIGLARTVYVRCL